MTHQIVQHHDDSQIDERLRTIPNVQRLFWKVMITFSIAMSLHRWLSGLSLVTLIGVLAISGCSSEHGSGKDKQTQQDKESTVTKPLHKQVGEASWYGPGFQGRETANGETFNQKEMTAAHPTLPIGTKAKVTNLENGKKVEVRINDRGPYAGNRAIDLSNAAANKLNMKKGGTTEVKIETKSVKKKKHSARKARKKKLATKKSKSSH